MQKEKLKLADYKRGIVTAVFFGLWMTFFFTLADVFFREGSITVKGILIQIITATIFWFIYQLIFEKKEKYLFSENDEDSILSALEKTGFSEYARTGFLIKMKHSGSFNDTAEITVDDDGIHVVLRKKHVNEFKNQLFS